MKKTILFFIAVMFTLTACSQNLVPGPQTILNVNTLTTGSQPDFLVRGTNKQVSKISWTNVFNAFSAAIPTVLPSQIGNTGKLLTTNGTTVSWITPNDLNETTLINNFTEQNIEFQAGAGLDFNTGSFNLNLMQNSLTANRNQGLPNGSGTLALSVNGQASNSNGDISQGINDILVENNEITTQDMIFKRDDDRFIRVFRGSSTVQWIDSLLNNSIEISPTSYYQSLPDGSFLGIDSSGGFNYNDFTSGYSSTLNQYGVSFSGGVSNSSSLSTTSLALGNATNSTFYNIDGIITDTGTYPLPTGISSPLATIANTNKGLQEVTDINGQTTNEIIVKDITSPSSIRTTIQDNAVYVRDGANIATLSPTSLNINNGSAGGNIVLGAIGANHTYTLPSLGAGTYTFAMTSQIPTKVNNATTVALTTSDLNTAYPSAIPGSKVYCTDIIAGPIVYEKTPTASVWIAYTVTIP